MYRSNLGPRLGCLHSMTCTFTHRHERLHYDSLVTDTHAHVDTSVLCSPPLVGLIEDSPAGQELSVP